MQETIGDKAICSMCGKPITFVGPYWDHDGEIKPRHPATPVGWKQVEVHWTAMFTDQQVEAIRKIVRDEIQASLRNALQRMAG